MGRRMAIIPRRACAASDSFYYLHLKFLTRTSRKRKFFCFLTQSHEATKIYRNRSPQRRKERKKTKSTDYTDCSDKRARRNTILDTRLRESSIGYLATFVFVRVRLYYKVVDPCFLPHPQNLCNLWIAFGCGFTTLCNLWFPSVFPLRLCGGLNCYPVRLVLNTFLITGNFGFHQDFNAVFFDLVMQCRVINFQELGRLALVSLCP